MAQHDMKHGSMSHGSMSHGSPYRMFAIMMAVNTLMMFVLMFEMIATADDFYLNLNMFYMALTMAAPMAILELALMGMMYPNRRLNLIIGASAVVVLIASFFAIRMQTGIGDSQFLRSMIPHHSGAILMCEEASISDPEIKTLCGEIIVSQEREIAQMKAILERY